MKYLITYPPFFCFVVIGHNVSNQKVLFITGLDGNEMSVIRKTPEEK